MPKYIQKPVEIEAVQWDHNRHEVMQFCRDLISTDREKTRIGFESGPGGRVLIYPDPENTLRFITNMTQMAWPGDYIVRCSPGVYTVIDKKSFEETYQPEQ